MSALTASCALGSRLSDSLCAALTQNNCRLEWDHNFRIITGANGVSQTAGQGGEGEQMQLNAGH